VVARLGAVVVVACEVGDKRWLRPGYPTCTSLQVQRAEDRPGIRKVLPDAE
jgi:hypothetical protein